MKAESVKVESRRMRTFWPEAQVFSSLFKFFFFFFFFFFFLLSFFCYLFIHFFFIEKVSDKVAHQLHLCPEAWHPADRAGEGVARSGNTLESSV